MDEILEKPLTLTAKQWNLINYYNNFKLSPNQLKLIGPICDMSEAFEKLRSYFLKLQTEKRSKRENARERKEKATAKGEEKGPPPLRTEGVLESDTDFYYATDDETESEFQTDLETDGGKEENVLTVRTTRCVDTQCVYKEEDRDDKDNGDNEDNSDKADSDDDNSYDGDESDVEMDGDGDGDEKMADVDGNNAGGEDDDNDADNIDVLPQEVQDQIRRFFTKHPLTPEMCHQCVVNKLGKQVKVRSADNQFGDDCYICYVDDTDKDAEKTMTFVQFLEQDLDPDQLAMADKLFGNLIPSFEKLGTLGRLFVWKLDCPHGVPLGQVLDELSVYPADEPENWDWDENEDDLARLINMMRNMAK